MRWSAYISAALPTGTEDLVGFKAGLVPSEDVNIKYVAKYKSKDDSWYTVL